jgi:hypothetical protein
MPQRIVLIFLVAALEWGGPSQAQQVTKPADPTTEEFTAGEPLKLSKNAKTYGGLRYAESASYDAARDLYVAVNSGMPQQVVPNDGYNSLPRDTDE